MIYSASMGRAKIGCFALITKSVVLKMSLTTSELSPLIHAQGAAYTVINPFSIMHQRVMVVLSPSLSPLSLSLSLSLCVCVCVHAHTQVAHMHVGTCVCVYVSIYYHLFVHRIL